MSVLRAALEAANEQIRQKDRQLVLLSETVADQARALRVRTVAEDDARDPIVRELWDDYELTIARETWAASVRGLMKAPLAHFGAMRVSEITRKSWVHYREKIRSKHVTRMGGPVSPRTHNLELTRMRALLNWAVDEGRIDSNPLARAKLIRAKKRRRTAPTEEDLARLLELATPTERAFVLLGFDCGMRFTECRTLTWRQIDFERGRIRCYWHVAKNHEERTTILTERAAEALRALERLPGCDHVFFNPERRKPWSKSAMWRWIRALIDRAGLVADPQDGNVHFHDGRRHWFSKMLRKGVRLPVAMELSGHQSLAAAEIYIDVSEEDLEEAQRLIEQPRRGPVSSAPAPSYEKSSG